MTAFEAVRFYATLVLRRLERLGSLPPGPRLRKLISDLRRTLERIGPAGVGADPFWDEKRAEFRRQLLTHDPRRFVALAPVAQTMFIDYPAYVAGELGRLRASADWQSRWRPALREPRGLRLPRCPYYPSSSGNRIHHAHHLLAWETFAGRRIGELGSVLEFGGGYGGMAALARALGFRGRYAIYDFPELNALQQFYLRANDIHAECLSDYAALQPLGRSNTLDLFIATWSLSETPPSFRRELLGRVKPRYWLLAYQDKFQDYDNGTFFREWCGQQQGWRWQTVAADLIPGCHHYLFGAPVSDEV